LLQAGRAQVVGFEPQPEALAELNKKKGPHETYLPHAIGDGGEHTLSICAAPGMTSLLRPNPAVLGLLHGFPEWARVLKTVRVQTKRLDDIPETAQFDYLKIDVQGAELMVFENAVNGLRDALIIQTEVEFAPLYIDQPLFSDVDQFLRRQGFVLHRFAELKSRVFKPLIVNKDIYAGLSQLFWADAIYIRDFTRLDLLSSEQLLRLATVLHDCYQSVDVVLYLLLEYDKRSGTNFGVTYQTQGLSAQNI
jgi:FkbM family methyltransferase